MISAGISSDPGDFPLFCLETARRISSVILVSNSLSSLF